MQKYGCPISNEVIPEVLVRIVAAETILLAVMTMLYPQWYIPLFLTLDFFLRGFLGKHSPLKLLGMEIYKLTGSKGKKVNAGPKKFAMKIGFWVALFMTIFAILNLTIALQITTITLIVAAGLEAVFNFCLGCKIFPYWQTFKDKLFQK